ncbi:hypothetical protein AMAG_08304 [Allomyces macrogynus ATCC 38327]|uniref:Uncharacterized protein n=1 Tax=Allomyces macrogynus (strain ATCC 38327) TaxID=578462 RepID=A0A0L0SKT7_ALLM3|nr:hypothetical protein AMAG_08304 [Allomyces macrogynus ATCC 38327]|eukprot:KNE63142.1 hypothetical protein AMAG_08304 [Allomyces macrogynus ATCC 38327]
MPPRLQARPKRAAATAKVQAPAQVQSPPPDATTAAAASTTTTATTMTSSTSIAVSGLRSRKRPRSPILPAPTKDAAADADEHPRRKPRTAASTRTSTSRPPTSRPPVSLELDFDEPDAHDPFNTAVPAPRAKRNEHPDAGKTPAKYQPGARIAARRRVPLAPRAAQPSTRSVSRKRSAVTAAAAEEQQPDWPPSPAKTSPPAVAKRTSSVVSVASSQEGAQENVAPPSLETLPTPVLRRVARYLRRRATLSALARCSRALFDQIGPCLWADPWDVHQPGAWERMVADERLALMLTEPGAHPVGADYAQWVCTPTSAHPGEWLRRAGRDAGTPPPAPLTLITSLDLVLDRHRARNWLEDSPTIKALVVNAAMEKYRRRFPKPFMELVAAQFAHLERLHIDAAQPFFKPLADLVETDGATWHHAIKDVRFTCHLTAPAETEFLTTFLRSLPDLQSLSLTVQNAATTATLAPLATAALQLTQLRRCHLIPPDDSVSQSGSLARFLVDFFTSLPVNCRRHLELYPTSEYSRSRYFTSLPAVLAPHRAAMRIHRLTLWLPPVATTLAHPAVLAVLTSAVSHHTVQIDLQSAWHFPSPAMPVLPFAGADAMPWMRMPVGPTPHQLLSHAAAVPTPIPSAPYPALDGALTAALLDAAPNVRVLNLPSLLVSPALKHLRDLAALESLEHVTVGLALPGPPPGHPPPGSHPDTLAAAASSQRRAARAVAPHAAYAEMALHVHHLIQRGPRSLKSVAWMSLPLLAGENMVFHTYQSAFARGKSGARSVTAGIGPLLLYEEIEAGWAFCSLGAHAVHHIRREMERGERGREAVEEVGVAPLVPREVMSSPGPSSPSTRGRRTRGGNVLR